MTAYLVPRFSLFIMYNLVADAGLYLPTLDHRWQSRSTVRQVRIHIYARWQRYYSLLPSCANYLRCFLATLHSPQQTVQSLFNKRVIFVPLFSYNVHKDNERN